MNSENFEYKYLEVEKEIPKWVVDHEEFMEKHDGCSDNECHDCHWFSRCSNYKIWMMEY